MENKVKRPRRAASFLKVLDGDFSNQLIIPPSFSKNFNGKIPPWFIIEIGGTRKCWRVDVEDNEDGTLKLTKGWNDFVEAHALELGNFLVFQYKRTLIFEVTIYDKDGSEKTEGQTSEFQEYRVEDSEHQHRSSKTYQEDDESHDVVLVDQSSEDEDPHVVGSTKRKTAEASVIGSGVGFSITWRDTKNLQYYLTIPKAFALEKNLLSKTGILLMNQKGKSWIVKLKTRSDGRVDLTQGWRDFLNDNKFTTGDTLTFEFLSDNLVQVHVESPSLVDRPSQSEKRCKTKPTRSLDPRPTQESSEHVEPAPTSTVNYKSPKALGNAGVYPAFLASSFSTTFTMSGRGYLHIPMRVAKEQNLHNKKTIVICDEEGKHWELGINIRRSDGRFTLDRGWSEFWKRNKIEVGDTLIFEFVADCMMKVKINRASLAQHAAKEAIVDGDIPGPNRINSPYAQEVGDIFFWPSSIFK